MSTSPRRRPDWLEHFGGATGFWLFTYVTFIAAASITSFATAEWIPWWGVLGQIAPIAIGAWVINALAHGYRLATEDEAAQIRAGQLWHLTGNDAVYDEATSTVRLDPAHCRWISRLWRRDRPLRLRRRQAVYVFTNPPRPAQRQIHVRRDQRTLLVRIEGEHIEGDIYVRPGGVVALTTEYHGPAQLEQE